MQVVAQFPSFREAWETLRAEYACYEEFQNFVADMLLPHTVTLGHEDRAQAVATRTTVANPSPSSDSSAKQPRWQMARTGGVEARQARAGRAATTIGQLRHRATAPLRRAWARPLKRTGR